MCVLHATLLNSGDKSWFCNGGKKTREMWFFFGLAEKKTVCLQSLQLHDLRLFVIPLFRLVQFLLCDFQASLGLDLSGWSGSSISKESSKRGKILHRVSGFKQTELEKQNRLTCSQWFLFKYALTFHYNFFGAMNMITFLNAWIIISNQIVCDNVECVWERCFDVLQCSGLPTRW